MCLYPKLIKNRKYTANKKNGGKIPAISDDRVLYVPIGCQNCIECRKQKARQWQTRLLEDIKKNTNARFITLTINTESIIKLTKEIKNAVGYELDNAIATLATRRFLERYRKKHKKSIRHWLVTELGHNGTENVHIHGIIWTDKNLNEIEQIWQYGYMWKGKEINGKIINYVNERTIGYITKYVTKIDKKHTKYKSIILTSPGIGSNYTKNKIGDWKKNKYNKQETNETYRTRTGHKISLPIYWRNKIYTEEEREQLWLNKLNKEIRYVLGSKIDISKNQKEYEKAIKHARKINTELGYGNDTKNYEQETYERERRIIMQKTRIAKKQKKQPPAG